MSIGCWDYSHCEIDPEMGTGRYPVYDEDCMRRHTENCVGRVVDRCNVTCVRMGRRGSAERLECRESCGEHFNAFKKNSKIRANSIDSRTRLGCAQMPFRTASKTV